MSATMPQAPRRITQSGFPQRRSTNVAIDERLLDELSFLHILRLERKRVARSGQRFVLMLIELGPTLEVAKTDPLRLNQFFSELLPSIRETDYTGWYEQNLILGVVFTHLGEASYGAILSALLQRVGHALTVGFGAAQIDAIRLSFKLFPEPASACGGESDPDFAFYRDLTRDLADNQAYRVAKRAVDILASLAGLIVVLPLFLAIAIAVRTTSKGPVLFRQKRIGQHFRPFTFYKFRSMYVNSDEAIHKAYVAQFIAGAPQSHEPCVQSGAVYKITRDPRVTRVGRFLRKTSLDELPQLLNVLRGDMSLVGPRPCVRYELERYAVWHRQRLIDVKPGITGLWQVTGRSIVGFDEMVRLDLAYVKQRSIWLDFRILLQTPRAVISGVGAY